MPVEMVEKAKMLKRILFTPKNSVNLGRGTINRVDYIELYEDIIRQQGCKPTIIISNDPLAIVNYKLDGVVVASVHTDSMLSKLKNAGQKAVPYKKYAVGVYTNNMVSGVFLVAICLATIS